MSSFICYLFLTIGNFQYGDLYLIDAEQPDSRASLRVGYAVDLSNSFLDLHSVVGDAQIRVWRYLSTGLLGHYAAHSLSATGRAFKQLETFGLMNKIKTPSWGVFSHSQVRLLRGKWNFFNVLPVEGEIFAGGGVGLYREKRDIDEKEASKISYLWSTTNRFHFENGFGVDLGVLGHRGGVYFTSGLSYSL